MRRRKNAPKIAYFDAFSGVSGDMILGALLDVGLPFDKLKKELAKLPVKEFELKVEQVEKQGIAATRVVVIAEETGIVRTWANISSMIDKSKLNPAVKVKAQEVFLTLARAEAKVHRKNIEQVHFHELGATDSIVDIVSAAVGLHMLGVERIICSPLPTGLGMVKTDHGSMPIPAPATLEILENVPIYSAGIAAELVTPTGAAIIKTYADSFGDMPPMTVKAIGYGAGTRDLDIPNVLRVLIGESMPAEKADIEVVLLAETNLDDVSPEVYTYLTDRLFDAGAMDVWLAPIYMKKTRPATALSVLAPIELEEDILGVLFEETSTLGVRVSREVRRRAQRESVTVSTAVGQCRVKIGRLGDRVVSIAPEYEDCAELAARSTLPIKDVYEMASVAAREMLGLTEKE